MKTHKLKENKNTQYDHSLTAAKQARSQRFCVRQRLEIINPYVFLMQ